LSAEIIQFVGMLVLLVAILIGSYWFVYAPSRRNFKRENDRSRLRDE